MTTTTPTNSFGIGDQVRVTTFGRTDAVGTVRELRPAIGRAVVRLPHWQADGYHLDVAVDVADLERA